MELAVATCEPRLARFGPILAEPRMVSPSAATTGAARRLLHPLRPSRLQRKALRVGDMVPVATIAEKKG